MIQLTTDDSKMLTRQSIPDLLARYYEFTGAKFTDKDLESLDYWALRKNLVQKQL